MADENFGDDMSLLPELMDLVANGEVLKKLPSKEKEESKTAGVEEQKTEVADQENQ